jgi:hypothetical protein
LPASQAEKAPVGQVVVGGNPVLPAVCHACMVDERCARLASRHVGRGPASAPGLLGRRQRQGELECRTALRALIEAGREVNRMVALAEIDSRLRYCTRAGGQRRGLMDAWRLSQPAAHGSLDAAILLRSTSHEFHLSVVLEQVY